MDEIEKSIKKLALLHFRTPPRVGVRAMVKLSAVFFLDELSITIGLGGGYETPEQSLKIRRAIVRD